MKRILLSLLIALSVPFFASAETISNQNDISRFINTGAGSGYTPYPPQIVYPNVSAPSGYHLGSADITIKVQQAGNYFLQPVVNGVLTAGVATASGVANIEILHFDLESLNINLHFGDTLSFFFGSSGSLLQFGLYGGTSSPTTSFLTGDSTFAPAMTLYTNNPQGLGTFNPTLGSDLGVMPDCGISDISACITNAFSWAFVAPESSYQEVFSLTLASSTPFSYLYDLGGYFLTLRNGTASSTVINVPFMGHTLKLFDSGNIASVLPNSNWVNFVAYLKTILGYFIYFAVLWIIWREANQILHNKGATQ